MAEVRIEALTKQFKGTTAVDNINLTFADGSLTVLVGPSGCGKTTLMRMIAGLEEPTDGQIFIGDTRVNDIPAWDRNVAMVFQSYALYPHMTVYDNMAFPLQARKLRKREIRPLIEQVAASLGIGHLLDRKPRQLSGGQMQRVALGRAIVRHPHVFLLDEPLSNLDALLRVETRAELKRLQRDLGVTTVYVTHDQEEAMTLADKLVVMNHGQTEQIGTPEEVYQSPRTAFVARFIGNPPMNLLPCRYNPALHALVSNQFHIIPPARYHAALQRAGRQANLLLGVRPELWALEPECQPEGYSIPASVYMREPLGKEVLFTLAVGNERVKALGPPNLQLDLNTQVWLTFAETAMHLFDAESGAALADGSAGRGIGKP